MHELIILIELFVIIYSSSASKYVNVDCRVDSATSRCICQPEEIGRFEVPLFYFNDSKTTVRTRSSTDCSELEIQTQRNIPTSLLIRNSDIFRNFSHLISLYISSSNMTFDPTYVISAKKWHQIPNDLFNKKGLIDLRVTNAKFNSRRHPWKLPHSLLTLNFSHNEYTGFDLRRCANLLNLDFQDNRLVRMPIFNDSATSMQKLNLLGNPLYEFTVESIASLCHLEELRFNYYSMGSPRRNCECKRLKEWINNLKSWSVGKFIFEGTFKCGDVSGEICKEFTLNEAIRRRDRCLSIRIDDMDKIYDILVKALIVVIILIGVIVSAAFLLSINRFLPKQTSDAN